MGAIEGGDLWLGVRQWMSSVIGTEKDTLMSRPLAATVAKSLCNLWMLLPWEGEATVIEQSSTYEIISPLGIDMCRGETYKRTSSREIGDPWGVPTETGEERWAESWNDRVQVLSDRKEETQSTI